MRKKKVTTTSRLYLLAGLLLLITAWCSSGNHQGDEHFQILEFAAYKLGLATSSDLAWEYHKQMRPALQPALAYLAYRVVGLGGEANPFHLAFLLRVVSGAFTLLVASLLYRRFAARISVPLLRSLLLVLLFHWCGYYNGVRFSSENWSGLAMVAGLLLYPIGEGGRRFMPAGGRSAFLAGLLFGLAFLFRYQMGLAVAGFGLWLLLVKRENWQNILAVSAGGILVVIACYPLSYWLYGEWTVPAWNYFASNLIEGKAARYGSKPWYGYFELVFLRGIPPLSIVYLIGSGIYCWRYRLDPVTWTVVGFVVVHSLLARKDIRFLFPLIPLLPVLIFGAAKWVEERNGKQFWHSRWTSLTLKSLWIINLLLLAAVMVRPANSGIGPLKFIYGTYPRSVVIGGPHARLPIAEGAVARFYLRPGTVIDTTGNQIAGTCVRAQNECLYLVRERGRLTPPPGARLMYTSRPTWLEPLNFMGWLDSQRWYYVYQLG